MTWISSRQSLGSLVIGEKGVPAKWIYCPRGNKSYWQKQNNRFYLLYKSWYFPDKHVLYMSLDL